MLHSAVLNLLAVITENFEASISFCSRVRKAVKLAALGEHEMC